MIFGIDRWITEAMRVTTASLKAEARKENSMKILRLILLAVFAVAFSSAKSHALIAIGNQYLQDAGAGCGTYTFGVDFTSQTVSYQILWQGTVIASGGSATRSSVTYTYSVPGNGLFTIQLTNAAGDQTEAYYSFYQDSPPYCYYVTLWWCDLWGTFGCSPTNPTPFHINW
jgi:hypothetical protein